MPKTTHSKSISIFPGTFDPPTNGHMDIIRRGVRLFDKLIVAVGQNPEKEEMFPPRERVDMLRELVSRLDRVEVRAYDGLTMDFAKACGAHAILRGIRDDSDLRYELQQANANLMVGGVETVFLLATDQNILTSSTLIKQIVELGGPDTKRLLRLVPPQVAARLRRHVNGMRARMAARSLAMNDGARNTSSPRRSITSGRAARRAANRQSRRA